MALLDLGARAPGTCYDFLGGGNSKPVGLGLRVRFGLSGVTPWEREELEISSRETIVRQGARLLTQGETRWSIPPSLRHAGFAALDRGVRRPPRR